MPRRDHLNEGDLQRLAAFIQYFCGIDATWTFSKNGTHFHSSLLSQDEARDAMLRMNHFCESQWVKQSGHGDELRLVVETENLDRLYRCLSEEQLMTASM